MKKRNKEVRSLDRIRALVPPEDIWIFIICTIRYSFGRQTYMPQDSVDFVIKYRDYLTEQQLEQIAHEIEVEIEMYERMKKIMGTESNHKTWKDAVAKIRGLIKEKADEEPF